jgi:hypothetical protein
LVDESGSRPRARPRAPEPAQIVPSIQSLDALAHEARGEQRRDDGALLSVIARERCRDPRRDVVPIKGTRAGATPSRGSGPARLQRAGVGVAPARYRVFPSAPGDKERSPLLLSHLARSRCAALPYRIGAKLSERSGGRGGCGNKGVKFLRGV